MLARFPGSCVVCGGDIIPRQHDVEIHPTIRGPKGGKKVCHAECLREPSQAQVRKMDDRLAALEKDPQRKAAFESIAASERRHASIWEAKLISLGEHPPVAARPSWRVRQISILAHIFGTRAVSDMVKALEGFEEEVYGAHTDVPEVHEIAKDEAKHAEIWRDLDVAHKTKGVGAHRAAVAETQAREPWHRSGGGGRACVCGCGASGAV
jgi:rubrerythrin